MHLERVYGSRVHDEKGTGLLMLFNFLERVRCASTPKLTQGHHVYSQSNLYVTLAHGNLKILIRCTLIHCTLAYMFENYS